MKLRFFGRHIKKNNKEYFSYSGTGFEFLITPKSNDYGFSISLTSELITQECQFVAIYINDVFFSKEKLVSGLNVINVSLAKQSNHTHVKIIKLNEAYISSIYLNEVTLKNAEFENIEENNKPLIGFFGDSLTCGFGLLDFHGAGFKMETEDFTKSYPYLTATKLNMDYLAVARSGISISIPTYVDKLFDEIYDTVDMYEKCEPDRLLNYAVVNIGTNDNSGYRQIVKDENKQKELNLFKQRYISLIDRIIKDNPNVKIVMMYLMLPLEEDIINAIKDVFEKVQLSYSNEIKLLECVPNSDGGGCHPYWTAHEKTSELLIKMIKSF